MALSDPAVRSVLTRSGPSGPPVPSDPWAYLLTRKRPRAALRSLEARVRGGWLSADPGALTAVLLALLSDPSRPPRVVLRCCRIFLTMDLMNRRWDRAARRASVLGSEEKMMNTTFDEWITARHACAVIGTNFKCLQRLVAQGKVTTRDLANCKRRYSLESCERLLKTSVHPALTH